MTSRDAAVLIAFRRLLAIAGVDVTYVDGALQIPLRVAIGKTLYQAMDARGVIEERDCRDYCFVAADLTTASRAIVTVPQRGHRIIEPTAAGSDTFDLLPMESDKPYRYMDPGRLILRVHTKRIATSDANV